MWHVTKDSGCGECRGVESVIYLNTQAEAEAFVESVAISKRDKEYFNIDEVAVGIPNGDYVRVYTAVVPDFHTHKLEYESTTYRKGYLLTQAFWEPRPLNDVKNLCVGYAFNPRLVIQAALGETWGEVEKIAEGYLELFLAQLKIRKLKPSLLTLLGEYVLVRI